MKRKPQGRGPVKSQSSIYQIGSLNPKPSSSKKLLTVLQQIIMWVWTGIKALVSWVSSSEVRDPIARTVTTIKNQVVAGAKQAPAVWKAVEHTTKHTIHQHRERRSRSGSEGPMKQFMQTFMSWGIAAKLVTIFVIFGAVPMTAVGWIAFKAGDDMKEGVGTRFQIVAQEIASKIDRNLFERYGDVQAFGYNDVLTRMTQWGDVTTENLIGEVMNKYVAAYGIYDMTIFVDTDGAVNAVNMKNAKGEPINYEPVFEKNFKDAPWFKALEAGEFTTKMEFTAPGNDISTGTYIEDVHIDPTVKEALGNDGYVISFSAPVYESNGTVMGYWSNRTNMNVVEGIIADAYQTMKASGFPGAEVTLLDSQGRVIVEYDPTTAGTEDVVRNFDTLMKLNLTEKDVAVAQKAVAGETGSESSFHARKEIDQTAGYTHLKGALGFPGMNWSVLVRVPETETLADANGVQNSVVTTGLICLAIMVPMGWIIGRSGARNLVQVSEVAQKAAEGDLTHRATVSSKDELGQLGGAFNDMMQNLTKVVGEVRQGAEHVSTGSAEITQGNEDLSERTSQQASALEETSASMEEMTSTIKQNADNAKQANQLAVAAREVAEKGGSVTEKAVEAMSEINKSSKKIADIINVIDEIAFQTNLLALNAAVEAARAGEQGRGFAVVASEVRNLAGRSATAAKEIKTLINESVQKVSDGSDLVNQSGQTLDEIVNSVKRVTDIISEISAASQEQAAGIDQVNKAVIQMDQSTQQNAALVEETTSASQSMKQQAGDLLDQVAFFKTEESADSESGRGRGSASGRVVSAQPQAKQRSSLGQNTKTMTKPSAAPSTKPEPASVGAGNGHDRRQGDDDFFEEF